MILANGKLYDTKEQNNILRNLEQEISCTLAAQTLDREKVMTALDKMSENLLRGEYSRLITAAGVSGNDIRTAAVMMSREAIEFRLRTELAEGETECTLLPPAGIRQVKAQLRPLGTLFHIAAGNAQGLPALSVLEGLVTGNVNILKLPRADDGLTLEIFRQLIKAEPALKSYVYIFDTPSSDIQAMQKMAQSADGIVTWGGDEAVKAVRTLAPAGAKLIEWGHKLGFAYISGYEDKNRELSELAVHIISTGQRLCSSCQTIFINTTSRDELEGFCSDFLPFLERATAETPEDIGETASRTLINYTAELEAAMGVKAAGMFCGKYCSLTVSDGSSLELSPMGNNCLVKAMPEKDIVPALRPFKGYLQTAGLICSRENRERLTDALMRAGVCRIMRAGNMSADIIGGCHDGEYGLRRFMRVVNTEI